MLIRLEYNGRIIHEIASAQIVDEIVIGRSHSCTWPVPKEENVCSSRHAKIFVKGKSVWLHDLESTNGTFHNGKRITKKKLAQGDKISIGNCLLCIEQEQGSDGKLFSELQILAGKERGQRRLLKPPVFTIGSDPSANLAFLDMLVSRRHAEIIVKDDNSCWIRDLGSKNGTTVNGVPLRDDKERLLKDGDRIAFSQYEAEFHDGAVARSNKQVWLRIAILAITLGAGLFAYNTYQRMRPSAESFLRAARRLAADEAFDEARKEVEKAATARGAASSQVGIEELRRQLGDWQNTVQTWARARENLAGSKWTAASRDLGMLQVSRTDAWEWNPKAAAEKEKMTAAKTLLDAYLRAEAIVGRDDAALADLADNSSGLAAACGQATVATLSYLASLRAASAAIDERLGALVKEYRELEQALDLLKETAPPFFKINAAVARALQSDTAVVKRRASVVEPALQALAESARRLEAAAVQARELKLTAALATDVKIPPADLCAIDPRISQARQNIEALGQNFRAKAGQFNMLLNEVQKRDDGKAEQPEPLALFTDATLFAQALACDVLAQPLPKRSRTAPAGAYDRLFGVEEFYIHLSAYPEPADPAMVADLPFISALTQLRELSQKIEDLLAFIRQPDNQWLLSDAVRARVKRCEAVIAQRDALMEKMAEQAATDTSRRGLIAAGIVARLATQPGKIVIKGQKPVEWVATELKRQRQPLIKANADYSLAAPQRQIEIRGEILAHGLPGDPLVRRMWSIRDSATQQ